MPLHAGDMARWTRRRRTAIGPPGSRVRRLRDEDALARLTGGMRETISNVAEVRWLPMQSGKTRFPCQRELTTRDDRMHRGGLPANCELPAPGQPPKSEGSLAAATAEADPNDSPSAAYAENERKTCTPCP